MLTCNRNTSDHRFCLTYFLRLWRTFLGLKFEWRHRFNKAQHFDITINRKLSSSRAGRFKHRKYKINLILWKIRGKSIFETWINFIPSIRFKISHLMFYSYIRNYTLVNNVTMNVIPGILITYSSRKLILFANLVKF